MADFRDISPKSITWRRAGRGNQIYASRPSEKSIKFQIPKMNCNIAVHSPGMFKLELKLSPSIQIHEEFMDWIADLEQSSKGPWGDLVRSSTIYNNGFRIMFFSDTNCFDSNGTLSADFLKAKSVSALLSLTGLWTTETKYGLKFKIEQFKYSEEPILYPTVEEEDVVVAPARCMFVDED